MLRDFGYEFPVADLFCGGGGTSTAMVEAVEQFFNAKPKLAAVNHWQVAVNTHTANHPDARHFCQDIEKVDPRTIFKRGELATLWASPSCTHHSKARGGKPVKDQQRSHAWCVYDWAKELEPPIVMIENVSEFLEWGPTIMRMTDVKCKKTKKISQELREFPDPTRKGEDFNRWRDAMHALGFKSEYRIICCANYGDPTTRERLFIIFAAPGYEIEWETFSHSKLGKKDPNGPKLPWVTAREIINWDHKGKSIFHRKKPLAANTIRRIDRGLRKFSLPKFIAQKKAQKVQQQIDFLVRMHGNSNALSTDAPLPTVEAHANKCGVADPFITRLHGTSSAVSIDDPLRTVEAGTCKHCLTEPQVDAVVVTTDNTKSRVSGARPVDAPLKTIVADHNRHAVAEPVIIPNEGLHGGNAPRSIDMPLPTATATHGAGHLMEPFIVPQHTNPVPKSTDDPLPTLMAEGSGPKLVEPLIIPNFGERPGQEPRVHRVDAPLPAVTSHGAGCLMEPVIEAADGFIVPKESGEHRVHSLDRPLKTVTCESRGEGLVDPVIVTFDNASNSNKEGVRPVTEPLSTIITQQRHIVAEPLVTAMDPVLVQCSHGGGDGGRIQDLEKPMPSLTTKNNAMVAEPVLVQVARGGNDDYRSHSVDKPIGTISTVNGHGVVQPEISQDELAFGTTYYGTGQPIDLKDPLDTVTTKSRFGVADPLVMGQQSDAACRPVTEPIPTVAAAGAISLSEPVVEEEQRHHTEGVRDIEEWLESGDPILVHGELGPIKFLLLGIVYVISDILYRMLEPIELARGQGFREDYLWTGTKSDIVRQIGNAVPRNTARALIMGMFRRNGLKLRERFLMAAAAFA